LARVRVLLPDYMQKTINYLGHGASGVIVL